MSDNKCAVAVTEILLEGHDFADVFEGADRYHVHRFVEHYFLAGLQRFGVNTWAHPYPHLFTAGHNVGGAILMKVQEGGISTRGFGKPIYFCF